MLFVFTVSLIRLRFNQGIMLLQTVVHRVGQAVLHHETQLRQQVQELLHPFKVLTVRHVHLALVLVLVAVALAQLVLKQKQVFRMWLV
jgi:hypothetical protein